MTERRPTPDVYIDRPAPGETVRGEPARPEVKRPRPGVDEVDRRRVELEPPVTVGPDRGRRL